MLEEMLSSGFAKYHPIYDWLVITRDGHVYSTKGGRNNKRTHEYYTYLHRRKTPSFSYGDIRHVR